MKELIMKMKCRCGRTVPNEKYITESVNSAGVYYSSCPYCETISIATSKELVPLDLNHVAPQIREDIRESAYKQAKDEIAQLNKDNKLSEGAERFLNKLVDIANVSMMEETEETNEVNKITNMLRDKFKEAGIEAKIIAKPLKDFNEKMADTTFLPNVKNGYTFDLESIMNKQKAKEKKAPVCNNAKAKTNVGRYIVIKDGKVITDVIEDRPAKEIYKELANRYGIEAIQNGSIIVSGLTPIKPNIKATYSFE